MEEKINLINYTNYIIRLFNVRGNLILEIPKMKYSTSVKRREIPTGYLIGEETKSVANSLIKVSQIIGKEIQPIDVRIIDKVDWVIYNLPKEEKGTIIIVGDLMYLAIKKKFPYRNDILTPGEVIGIDEEYMNILSFAK